MSHLRYITHLEVVIAPSIPVGRWGLDKVGASRAKAMLAQPWVARIGRVVCSDETKAIETAEILGEHLGLDIEVRADTAENDRTATGFLHVPTCPHRNCWEFGTSGVQNSQQFRERCPR